MIARAEMMGMLLDTCPSFAPKWQEFQDEWRDEADGPPLYLVLADLARHLIGMLERGDTAGLRGVFPAVERLHVEGEHWVREAATVGLLESLQNHNLHGGRHRPGAVSTVPWTGVGAVVGEAPPILGAR